MDIRTHGPGGVRNGKDGEAVTVAGWVHEVRDHGGIVFVLLRSWGGFVQATALKKALGEAALRELASIPRESVISVIGKVVNPPKAEVGAEVAVESWRLISKAETPLPLGPADNVEISSKTVLDHRAIHLRLPASQKAFQFRDDLLRAVRASMAKRGFVEVATPKLVSSGAEGGASLFPVDYFGKRAFLAQSPQLYKQMLMGSGFDRVFEIGPAFRAEPSDTSRHLSEFTSFDAEMSFIDGMEDVMQALEEVVNEALEALGDRTTVATGGWRFPRVSYPEAVEIADKRGVAAAVSEGLDLTTEAERAVGAEMAEQEHAFYFITHYPHEAKPFYIMEEEHFSRSFDLAFRGHEIASGGQREHRYDALIDRMRHKRLDPDGFTHYLEPFRFGMPPHGGWGLGVERLAAALHDAKDVRDLVLFPRDRDRLVP